MDSSKPEETREGSEPIQAAQQEIARLTALRQAVANGLLEVSAAAKRDAERLLSGGEGETTGHVAGTSSVGAGRSNSLLYGSFAFGLLCGVVLAVLLRPSESVPQISEVAEVTEVAQPVPQMAETPIQPEEPSELATPPSPSTDLSPVPPAQTDPGPEAQSTVAAGASNLVLVLTTRDDCWLSTSVDGAEPLERLLPAGRTVRLQAQQEAVLKIGNAAAVSVLINGQPTRPLGVEGQVVTLRVTPLNFQSFLS
jgi:hypothetical protein